MKTLRSNEVIAKHNFLNQSSVYRKIFWVPFISIRETTIDTLDRLFLLLQLPSSSPAPPTSAYLSVANERKPRHDDDAEVTRVPQGPPFVAA